LEATPIDESGNSIFGIGTMGAWGEWLSLGYSLLSAFYPDNREQADEVRHILYITQANEERWRRGVKNRPFRSSRISNFEIIIFKMPRDKTFWQILKIYRKENPLKKASRKWPV